MKEVNAVRRGRRGRYGGFLGPILSAMANAIARELLVQTGRKKPYRGGARIRTWRDMFRKKD